MGFQLTNAQAAAVENRGGALLVSAAAGSGKTRVLVERLLGWILKDGKDIDNFLIITFTKAAAEELRSRISEALAEQLPKQREKHHLLRQMALLYQAQFSTVHAFCSALLREWGALLDLPPDFKLCEEEDADILKQQVLEELLEARYEELTQEAEFARLLDLLSGGRDDRRIVEIVLDIYHKMQSHYDPKSWMKTQLQRWQLCGVEDVGQTEWGRTLLKDSEELVQYWRTEMEGIRSQVQEDEQLIVYEESLLESVRALDLLAQALEESWDAARECFPIPFPRFKSVRSVQDPARKESVQKIREGCKKAMLKLNARFESSSETLLEDMKLLYPAVRALFSLVDDFMEAFTKEKRRKNMLDFSDLEHLALQLLQTEEGRPTQLALELRPRFTEIMVDEYQDTNQIQNAIFSAISQEGKNLFFVGDVKQSIYRFRLADPGIFLGKYRSFLPYEKALPGQERKIILSENFRSRPEILSSVNDVFQSIMSKELGEMDYGEAEALYPGAEFLPAEGRETELILLDFTQPGESEEEETPKKQQLEAQFVAARIAEMLEDGVLISDGADGMRPAKAEDIAILLRSPGPVRHHYVSALRELGIACANEAPEDFFSAIEVSLMLSYLQIIDNPHQDVPLLAVLHSPLWGFDGERLAQIRLISPGDFYTALLAAAEKGEEDCRSFLTQLNALRFLSGELSSHQLLWQLYEQSSVLDIVRRLPGGAGREERLLLLYELACRFEEHGHRGLFRFLHHMRNIQEHGVSVSLSEGGSKRDGVNILSIHRSKGLEYPIVFLAGLGKQFHKADLQQPVLFHQALGLGPKGVDVERGIAFQTLPRRAVALALQKELLAEEMRLLYVAMTRAREKLVMTHSLRYGVSELKKIAMDAKRPLDPKVLEDCDSVGKWLILSAMPRPEAELLQRLAEYEGEAEGGFASRWKIEYHQGVPEPRRPLYEEALADREPGTPCHWEELWENLLWSYPNDALRAIPAKLTATQLSQGWAEQSGGAAISREIDEEPLALPRRPRFAAEALGLSKSELGTAYHTVLQSIRLSQSGRFEAIMEEIKRLVREAFLTEQEAAALDINSVLRFFQSEIGQELRNAEKVHRETPFSVLLPAKQFYPDLPGGESILLQGVIDCWYESPEGITLLDFKTNIEGSGALSFLKEHYRPQLEAYALALEEMTGRQVVKKLIWLLHPGEAIVYEAAE